MGAWIFSSYFFRFVPRAFFRFLVEDLLASPLSRRKLHSLNIWGGGGGGGGGHLQHNAHTLPSFLACLLSGLLARLLASLPVSALAC